MRFADWIAERILFGKRGDVNGEIEQPSCHLAIDILTYEHVEDQSIEGGPPGNDLKYGCPRQKHGMSASASAHRTCDTCTAANARCEERQLRRQGDSRPENHQWLSITGHDDVNRMGGADTSRCFPSRGPYRLLRYLPFCLLFLFAYHLFPTLVLILLAFVSHCAPPFGAAASSVLPLLDICFVQTVAALCFLAMVTQYMPLPSDAGAKHALSETQPDARWSPSRQRLTIDGSRINGRLMEM